MKKLFILICTLALGSALSFAQASSSKPENQTPAASTSQGSATTTKTKKSKVKKTKKVKKGATDTTPSAAPATTPK
jgi:uncharacterized protein YdeI (BOF family)